MGPCIRLYVIQRLKYHTLRARVDHAGCIRIWSYRSMIMRQELCQGQSQDLHPLDL